MSASEATAVGGTSARVRPFIGGMVGVTFLGGAAVMAVEIVASRLAAQVLGASLYTWTSTIGVVLAGLMIGNYLGGRVADAYSPRRSLSYVLSAGAVVTLGLPAMNGVMSNWEFTWTLGVPARAALHVFCVFAPATVVLGMISPLAAKAALDLGGERGWTVGCLSAGNAVGSIVGTFAAGFVLVAELGSGVALCVVALATGVAAVLVRPGGWAGLGSAGAAAACVVLASAPGQWALGWSERLGFRPSQGRTTLFSTESAYSSIRVDRDWHRRRNVMRLDQLTHAIGRPEDPRYLGYAFQEIYAGVTAVTRPAGRPMRALMIGGGGYIFPRYYLDRWPDATMEAVEIDPEVTQAAVECFGLRLDEPRLRVVHRDGRNRVRNLVRAKRRGQGGGVFDFVYLDAFDDYAVPHHLTTIEYLRMVKEILAPDGRYLVNLIDDFRTARFLGAMICTTRAVFSDVQVFCTSPDGPAAGVRDTYVIVAGNEPWDVAAFVAAGREVAQGRLSHLGAAEVEQAASRGGGLILTDDYAPVQHLLADVVRTSTRQLQACVERARQRLTGGDAEGAARDARRALDGDAFYGEAALMLALARAAQGRHAEAASVLEALLRVEPANADALNVLGLAYRAMGHSERARRAFELALKLDPERADVNANLGRVFVEEGKFDAAMQPLESAVRIYAGDPGEQTEAGVVGVLLGQALLACGRAEEGEAALRAAVQRAPEHGAAHAALGGRLYDTGRAAEAAPHLVRAFELGAATSDTLFRLGALAMSGNDPAAAATFFARRAALLPEDSGAHFDLGLALKASGRVEESIAAYGRALELRPEFADARYNLGNALLERGRWDEAAGAYRRVITDAPGYAAAYVNLARVEAARGRLTDALECLRRGVAATHDAGVRRELAQHLCMGGDEKLRDGAEALRLARELVEGADGRQAGNLMILGAALAETGDFAGAVRTIEEALSLGEASAGGGAASEMKRCLALYRAGRRYEAPGSAAGGSASAPMER